MSEGPAGGRNASPTEPGFGSENNHSERVPTEPGSDRAGEFRESGKRHSIQDFLLGNKGDNVDKGGPQATFVDAAAMKEKVRQNLSKPQHNITDFYKQSGCCVFIATNARFEQVTLAVIMLNALWIAIDTDQNEAQVLIEAEPQFIIAENVFCLFFTFELMMRWGSFKYKRHCLKDLWFIFDALLVGMMVLETWLLTLLMVFFFDMPNGGSNASVLRVARLMRLTRMARMARLVRAMPELMIMIKGMVAAVRSVFFTLVLLAIITYVFGIAVTQLAKDLPSGQTYFKSVTIAMNSLTIHGTLLDDVSDITGDLAEEPFYMSLMFFCFVLLASLTVMNMLIGVLCEVVSAVASTEKEEMLVTYVHQRLRQVMRLLDEDGGGTISKAEFIKVMENAEACRFLADIGVDVIGLVDVADFIFDEEMRRVYASEKDRRTRTNEEQELTFEKFMEVVLQLRGTNNATVKDVVDLRKFVRNAVGENQKVLDELRVVTSRMYSAMTVDIEDLPNSRCLSKFKVPSPMHEGGNGHVVSKFAPAHVAETFSWAGITNPHEALEPAPEPDRFTVTTKAMMLSSFAPEAMPLPEYAIDAIVPTIPHLDNERVGLLDFDEASQSSTVESNPDVDVWQKTTGASLLQSDAVALLGTLGRAELPHKVAELPPRAPEATGSERPSEMYEEFLRSTRTLGMQLLERLDQLQLLEEGRRQRTVSATGRFDSTEPVSIIWRDL